MPLWGNTDANTALPHQVLAQLNKDSANNTLKLLLHNNTTSGLFVTNVATGMFGVDSNEQAAVKAAGGAVGAHAGWNLRIEGTGGREGRVFYETIVAMGSISGDSEDSVFVDYTIVITSQPQDSEEASGNAVSFSVSAHTVPSGGTLTYKWQRDGGPAAQTWADIANTGLFVGNISSTLSVSNNSTLGDNTFRVLVNSAGATQVVSANAVLTILA